MFERSDIKTLERRVKEPRRFIHVVTGPRQVGKTTMVKQLENKLSMPTNYVSADGITENGHIWINNIWETSRLKLQNSENNEFLLIIDEIQKIDNWSESVKRLWDEDSLNDVPLKVILLGSSRLLIQKGLTESLAGRFEVIYLTHWSFLEMHEAFGLTEEEYVLYGGFPGAAPIINDQMRWRKYIRDSLVETSISKDILMLTRIDKPALLRNLFDLGCLYSGQILSFTKVLGQLQDAGNTTTLSHYLQLLETAGLLAGIEKYSGSIVRKRSSSPKFQVFNNALLNSIAHDDLDQVKMQPEKWGRAVESAIGSHLINMGVKNDFNVYYWRDRGLEVDFVLERYQKVIAIEVKSSVAKNLRGINAFQLKFKPAKTIIIDNKGLTWKEFLRINPVDLF
jgi:predicted AAA+ superfamily ATPase